MSFVRSAGSPVATLVAAGLMALTAAAPVFATELAKASASVTGVSMTGNAPSALTVPTVAVSGAVDATIPQSIQPRPAVVFGPVAEIVQPVPQDDADASIDDDQRYATLDAAVAAQHADDEASRELTCLAAGVYFESKGEPLAGQLAVAETILNRTRSGRFPASVCGVLSQRGQFSFVRGGVVPTAEGRSGWKTAVGVAKVALRDLWTDVAPRALFFHASYVSPNWRAARVARIGNHIFYR